MKLLTDPVERLLYLALVVLFLAGGLGIAIISIEINSLNTLTGSIKSEALVTRQHTDCVANLLAQPNRGSIRIQDLEDCRIGP